MKTMNHMFSFILFIFKIITMKTMKTMNHMFMFERTKYLAILMENYNYDNYENYESYVNVRENKIFSYSN